MNPFVTTTVSVLKDQRMWQSLLTNNSDMCTFNTAFINNDPPHGKHDSE